jgi:hypothetical protein
VYIPFEALAAGKTLGNWGIGLLSWPPHFVILEQEKFWHVFEIEYVYSAWI